MEEEGMVVIILPLQIKCYQPKTLFTISPYLHADIFPLSLHFYKNCNLKSLIHLFKNRKKGIAIFSFPLNKC